MTRRSSRSQVGEEKKPLTKKSKCLRSRREEGRAERYSNGRYEENEEKQNRKEGGFQEPKGITDKRI